MAALAGYGGKFQIGSNTITTVESWELAISSGMYDTTTIQNVRAKSFIPGLYEGTATIKGNWDASDTNGLFVLQTQVLAASPTIASLSLSTNNGTNNYTCSGYVKDLKVSDPVNNKVAFDATITISGAISYS